MLATLYNIFSEARGKSQFSLANADHHIRVNDAIFGAYSLLLPYYVLDPIPSSEALNAWLWNHQDVHNQMNAVAGVTGNDLTTVDFRDTDQVASWVWLHADEHMQVANILGVF